MEIERLFSCYPFAQPQLVVHLASAVTTFHTRVFALLRPTKFDDRSNTQHRSSRPA